MENKLQVYWVIFEKVLFAVVAALAPYLYHRSSPYDLEGAAIYLVWLSEIVAFLLVFPLLRAFVKNSFSFYAAGEAIWKSQVEKKTRKGDIPSKIGSGSKPAKIVVIICSMLVLTGLGIAFVNSYSLGTGLALFSFKYLSDEIKFGSLAETSEKEFK